MILPIIISDATNHLENKNSPRPLSICFVAKQPAIFLQQFLLKQGANIMHSGG